MKKKLCKEHLFSHFHILTSYTPFAFLSAFSFPLHTLCLSVCLSVSLSLTHIHTPFFLDRLHPAHPFHPKLISLHLLSAGHCLLGPQHSYHLCNGFLLSTFQVIRWPNDILCIIFPPSRDRIQSRVRSYLELPCPFTLLYSRYFHSVSFSFPTLTFLKNTDSPPPLF